MGVREGEMGVLGGYRGEVGGGWEANGGGAMRGINWEWAKKNGGVMGEEGGLSITDPYPKFGRGGVAFPPPPPPNKKALTWAA